ncbi:MAG: endopeptidase La [Candidatus Cloacimonetes bacterium 4572_65]|nr:MAG: endopeptidase La [Candidatus Cloacimonetes bacterium 4572_65]
MNEEKKIPRTLPVLVDPSLVLFPFMMMPVIISEPERVAVIDYALSHGKVLGLFLEKESENSEKSEMVEVYEYGTAATIAKMIRNKDGSVSLLLQGNSRVRMEKIIEHEPLLMVEVESLPERLTQTPKVDALRKIAVELLVTVAKESDLPGKEFIPSIAKIEQTSRVADLIAENTDIKILEKQDILSTVDLVFRIEKLNKYLADLIKKLQLENKIRSNVELEMTEDQKRYFLKEQLHAIMKELGEDNEIQVEINRWREKIEKSNLPDYVLKAVEEELGKLKTMQSASSEYSVIRNYLDWLVNTPWNDKTEDCLDLKKIDQILTKDHFGLEKAKERIIEFIAVKKLRQSIKGPILCFVGPPGVGKTSIGKSVARALNRKFIRMSLGGVHDEAEIRGHRKTYIGAMPGKILTELKRAGSSNPIFMLDEIDKLGKDFRGDPASALLEVLDPEQNDTFVDHYLNLPYDLSDVMFITTANSLRTVPRPLLDRMEVIEFSSYVENEKIEIARRYLIPREMENNGITGANVRIMKSALQEIIRYYVKEAGVRSLQRTIGTVMRKIARKVAEGDTTRRTVTNKNIKEFLGFRKFSAEMKNREPEIGVTTGLAWTMYGGEILFCEAISMPGKGGIKLTGQLGKVMQESAQIAISYLHANYEKYSIDPKKFTQNDLHIHFPAGAIPKDGPSAGVTLTTSIASLLIGKKVKHDVAMTGEITLQGKVLPIGGLREKVLAAKRAGIRRILVPWDNQDSIAELPDYITKDIEITFAKNVDDVLDIVLIN